jgi:riboflavin kinase / FMN adenylyltransferase
LSELMELRKIDGKFFKSINPVIVIGFFDGVHLGHRRIIRACVKRAKGLKSVSMALTFNKPPINIIKNTMYKKLIISYEEKVRIIKNLNIDYIVTVNSDSGFLKLSPGDFCNDILVKKLHIKEIFVGDGFHFGFNAAGDIEFLKNFFEPRGVKVNVVPLVKVKGEIVSSTSIRKYYSEGKIKKITALLGRNPQIEGKVVEGEGRGRELGFPTANIDVCEIFVTPLDGVYLGMVKIINNNKLFPAIINIGNNPTFKGAKRWIEAFLLGFNENIYGEKIKITFLERLRDEISFENKGELIGQMKIDLDHADKYFKKIGRKRKMNNIN